MGEQLFYKANSRLLQVRRTYRANIPTHGMDTPKMEGNERAGIMRFLAPALLGLAPEPVTQLILGKLQGHVCMILQAAAMFLTLTIVHSKA